VFKSKPLTLPTAAEALAGRQTPMPVNGLHRIFARPLLPPWPPGSQIALFGLGCFWGAERRFWQQPGVVLTMVGYSGGITPNPTYEEVCSGLTGHNEVVQVIYDPALTDYDALLRCFWTSHDPTQGMRQGNDRGTQYRSGIYTFDEDQQQLALTSRDRYQQALSTAGKGQITTEIVAATPFYYAESYHQQYLDAHPNGYCGLGGTGVAWPSSTR
jgi:peptide-methionine (S)-S-oxide reductase